MKNHCAKKRTKLHGSTRKSNIARSHFLPLHCSQISKTHITWYYFRLPEITFPFFRYSLYLFVVSLSLSLHSSPSLKKLFNIRFITFKIVVSPSNLFSLFYTDVNQIEAKRRIVATETSETRDILITKHRLGIVAFCFVFF